MISLNIASFEILKLLLYGKRFGPGYVGGAGGMASRAPENAELEIYPYLCKKRLRSLGGNLIFVVSEILPVDPLDGNQLWHTQC